MPAGIIFYNVSAARLFHSLFSVGAATWGRPYEKYGGKYYLTKGILHTRISMNMGNAKRGIP